ncbi:MAG: PilZ domain-containing protein [Desulfobulbaceae bacterium]|nr:PilZ domain-containing protein [Desulfobulbaceae bacterium]
MKAKTKEQPEQTKNKIIRHVYRLPIEEEDKVAIAINGTNYEVINLGANGVGILVDEESAFAAGQQLDGIKLQLDTDYLQLQGRIVHVSPRDFQLICGIEFIKMGKDNEGKMLNFLRRQRDNFFGGK